MQENFTLEKGSFNCTRRLKFKWSFPNNLKKMILNVKDQNSKFDCLKPLSLVLGLEHVRWMKLFLKAPDPFLPPLLTNSTATLQTYISIYEYIYFYAWIISADKISKYVLRRSFNLFWSSCPKLLGLFWMQSVFLTLFFFLLFYKSLSNDYDA